MQCVKCDEGVLEKIKFVKTGEIAYACNYCLTFWAEGELIKYNTGHALNPYHPGDDNEYAIQELSETDEDRNEVRKTRIL